MSCDRCSPLSATARRAPRDADDGARAPAGLRPLPRDDAHLPGGAANRRRAGCRRCRPRARCSNARRSWLAGLGSRLPGVGGGDSAATQVAAAGGSRGAGMAALAKLLARLRRCRRRRGCVRGDRRAAGVAARRRSRPRSRRSTGRRRAVSAASEDEAVDYEPAPAPAEAPPSQAGAAPHGKGRGARPGQRRTQRHGSGSDRIRSARARTGAAGGEATAAPSLERLRGRGVRPMTAGPPHCNALRLQEDEKRCTSRSPGVIVCDPSWRYRSRWSAAAATASCSRSTCASRAARTAGTPSASFALRWSNPPGVAAVHYRLLEPRGGVAGRRDDPAPGRDRDRAPQRLRRSRRLHGRGLAGGRRRREGPAVSAKLRFDDARPGHVEPLARRRLDRPLGLPLHAPPQPPARSPAALRHPRLRRLDRPSADGEARAPARRLHRRPRPTCAAASPATRCRSPSFPRDLSYVHAVAVSGSGMRSAPVGTAILRVDKTDPVTRLAGVPGALVEPAADADGDRRSTQPRAWSRPAPAGPFTAIRVDGGTPITAPRRHGVTATVIGVRRPHGRLLRPRRRRQRRRRRHRQRPAEPPARGDGGQDRPRAPDARLRCRPGRPGPGADRGPGVRTRSPASTPAGARSRSAASAPASASRRCRRRSSAGALRAHWDSERLPGRRVRVPRHRLRRGRERDRLRCSRADGSPMRLHSPLKVAVTLISRAAASERFATAAAPRSAGRALVGRRTPLAGVPVRVVERFAAGRPPRERVSTRSDRRRRPLQDPPRAGTEPRGRSPSAAADRDDAWRQQPAPGLDGAQPRRPARLPPASPGSAGRPVVFRGKVGQRRRGDTRPTARRCSSSSASRACPGASSARVRTDPRGRFRYPYRFADDDSRGVRFQFRAFAPAQAGWPFEPAGSLPVSVLGT